MTAHNLFHYPYAFFTNAQLPLLKVAALYFDKVAILDLVGVNWASSGADHHAREAVGQLTDSDADGCPGEVRWPDHRRHQPENS